MIGLFNFRKSFLCCL